MAEISFGQNPRQPLRRDATFQIASVHSISPPIVTSHSGLPLRWRDGMPIVASPTYSDDCYAVLKRAMDIVMAIAAIIVLTPLLLGVALAIRLTSPGPVLFGKCARGGTTRCSSSTNSEPCA